MLHDERGRRSLSGLRAAWGLAAWCLFWTMIAGTTARAVPYGSSPVIDGITWDLGAHDERAPGSDNWPITWADDDNQYTAWGDGGGFGGTNSDGRVSLGVARVEGPADSYTGHNVWGGKNPENPAQFAGKSYGILSVDGDLYMWLRQTPPPAGGGETHARLAKSTNHGATWTRADWDFTPSTNLISGTFLNFGKDYAGARDNYVYSYFIHANSGSFTVFKPGMIDLARVPKDQIMNQDAYEFFNGFDGDGAPQWSADPNTRQPVFEDATGGVSWTTSVSYNAGLDRYLLMTEHDQTFQGKLGIFDAPNPWGPWSTVQYTTNWEGLGTTFFWNFSNKWTSPDGFDTTVVFTGTGGNDSWNTVPGTFHLVPPPPATVATGFEAPAYAAGALNGQGGGEAGWGNDAAGSGAGAWSGSDAFEVVNAGDAAEGTQYARLFDALDRAKIVRDFPTIPTGHDFSLQYQIRLTSDGLQGSYFQNVARFLLLEPGSDNRLLRAGIDPDGFFEMDDVDLVRFDGTDPDFPSAKSALGQWVKVGYNFRWDADGAGGTIEAFWEDDATGDLLLVGTLPFANGNEEMSASQIKLNGPTAWQAGEGIEYDGILFDTTSLIVPGPGVLLGDVNLDGVVNGLDVGPFVHYVTSGQYQAEADMNQDDVVNGLDVGPFVDAVVGGEVRRVPEPSTWVLTGLAVGLFMCWQHAFMMEAKTER